MIAGMMRPDDDGAMRLMDSPGRTLRPSRSFVTRREILMMSGLTVFGLVAVNNPASPAAGPAARSDDAIRPTERTITLFLCGDVMTGRGIDQILPHPADPVICEPYVGSALGYVELAEAMNGPIARPVDYAYIWGDARAELDRVRPDARIVNLETAVTERTDCLPKGINYKMSPRNVPCLTAAAIDCCVLANNHVIDWGYAGLEDTLDALAKAGIGTAGAGRNDGEAAKPSVIDIAGRGRAVVIGLGTPSSGIPRSWAASPDRAGVNLVGDLSRRAATAIARKLGEIRRPGDVVVASIHWGGNWGYTIPEAHVRFAHALIDEAKVDVVHGHSSHHPRAIEIYNGRLVLYGCGDFLNDYEGITGYEEFRDDLTLAYFPTVSAASGTLRRLEMTLFRIRNFRLVRASPEDTAWVARTLSREGERFGTRVVETGGAGLMLDWS